MIDYNKLKIKNQQEEILLLKKQNRWMQRILSLCATLLIVSAVVFSMAYNAGCS